MRFIASLLTSLPYFNPIPPAGWLVWLGLAGLLGLALYNWRGYQTAWNRRTGGIFAALFAASLPASLLIGLKFSAASLPMPGLPADPPGSTLMFLSALPWMLAGGWLGPLAAAALGILSGFLRGFWDTHNAFTTLDLALMAGLFAVFVRQNYRTPFFRFLRQPLAAALSLIPFHVLVFIVGAFFAVPSAPVTERLDYVLSNAGLAALAFGGEMLLAGLAAQIVMAAFPVHWGSVGSLQPSPAERSIETRFLSGAGTVIVLLLVTLLLGDWFLAGRAARDLLERRLASAAQSASQSVPLFIEAGQNLASQIASDPRLSEGSGDLSSLLGEQMRSVPYFNQLILLEAASNAVLASYPPEVSSQPTVQEEMGTAIAMQGVPFQMYAIPPGETGGARIAFLAALPGSGRVLIARTDLQTNPYLRSLADSLNSLQDLNGAGMLVDEQGMILYHPHASRIMTPYTGGRPPQAGFYQETAPNGARQLVYYQPVPGAPWSIVLTVPAQETQKIAIDIALPISVMIVLLGLFALISLRLSLRTVTGSLQSLAVEAKHIAAGKLDRPLATGGVDEVGELRRAFEQMRVSLQGRLDELNRLLAASQGVASTLQLDEALSAILKAVVESGASAARIVLVREMMPGLVEIPIRYASGPDKDLYAHLDQPILDLTERQERLVMAALSRTRGLDLDPNLPRPESLSAVALRHENRYFGVLWAAYKKQKIFNDADLRFLATLASQAALAVANIRLFLAVDASRRQLETILNSTPDPVLVTDASNRLILANPAASQLFNVIIRRGERQDLQRTIQIKPLYDLLQEASAEKRTAEIKMPDGKTFLATASAMTADGRTVGRVCILRDVTQLKEIDTLKSEFVSTVSHDLRSPLTLMRGYATMLETSGDLNEQQKSYVRMIVQGVENMSRLVNNLLDLGRIDFGVGLQVEDVPVLDILERVTADLQMAARSKNIALSMELPRDMPHAVEADPALLHQAVYNLVENAIKYTPDGGEVTVNLLTAPDALTFAIHDSGIGIQPEDMKRLFEKFFRGTHREALAQRGTGLGLAIVKSIAERHHGKVWAESELGKGSTFFLQIPLTQPKETRKSEVR
ncbi:MAG: ATP-binding protein [Chloroflexota bacterium]|nr:HAMP domain-containing protein [Chloroflexota bacterium]MBI5705226.1 HAMP domain-containing protein [Chloroflexota bacterium]